MNPTTYLTPGQRYLYRWHRSEALHCLRQRRYFAGRTFGTGKAYLAERPKSR